MYLVHFHIFFGIVPQTFSLNISLTVSNEIFSIFVYSKLQNNFLSPVGQNIQAVLNLSQTCPPTIQYYIPLDF